MSLTFDHAVRPDPDGLRPAARTLRETERDPFDWIQDADELAANAPQLGTEETAARDPRVVEPRVLRTALLIALVTLLALVAAAFGLRG